jgi:hypothetical protein
MQPGHIYFMCLAIIVMPLLPFSRTAVVVGLAWLPGQFSYLLGVDPGALEILVCGVACVAAWLASANDRDRAIGLLYLPTAAVHLSAMLGHTDAYSAWWLDWYFAMARVLLLPLTVNWHALREVYEALKTRRASDDIIWKRVLCWQ